MRYDGAHAAASCFTRAHTLKLRKNKNLKAYANLSEAEAAFAELFH